MSKRKYNNMPVWDFYEKNESSKLVTCKHCPKSYCLLKIANSHKAPWYHLETKHSSLLIPHDSHENPAKKRKLSTLLDIHSCLKTIPPTSVEAERVFSVTGLFLTKLRSRLSDVTLDKLIFLKYYFLNKA